MSGEDSGRNYVTNAVISEQLKQMSKTIDSMSVDLKTVVKEQAKSAVDRETMRGQISNLIEDSKENKDEHKTLKTRSNQYDLGILFTNMVAAIVAAIIGASTK